MERTKKKTWEGNEKNGRYFGMIIINIIINIVDQIHNNFDIMQAQASLSPTDFWKHLNHEHKTIATSIMPQMALTFSMIRHPRLAIVTCVELPCPSPFSIVIPTSIEDSSVWMRDTS